MTDQPLAAQLAAINLAFAKRESDLLAELNLALADLGARNDQVQRLTAQLQHDRAADAGADRAPPADETGERLRAVADAVRDAELRHEREINRIQREHNAQLLGMQERAINDRDRLSLAHARQLASVQQQAASEREALTRSAEQLLQSRLEAAERHRSDLEQALRQQLEDREAALAKAHEQLRDADQRHARLAADHADARSSLAALGEQHAATVLALEALLAHVEAAGQHRLLLLQAVGRSAPPSTSPTPPSPPSATAGLPPATAQPSPHTVEPEFATMNPHAPAPATSVDELLSHHDARFVACVYLTLLKRPVDDEGLAAYTRHLRAGMSRAEIAASLADSEEGRAARVDLPGLAQWLAEARPRPPSVWQRLARHLAALALRPLVRQLNRIENQVGRVLQDAADRQLRIERQLADALRQSDRIQRDLSEAIARLAAPVVVGAPEGGASTAPPAAAVALDGAAIERARRLLAREKAAP